ncbi:MAG TPA: PLD nuclease N-terminal domain-containing protein [bacterium]|nr:PLD nuclease N-terminal domain-containing protein [bacterium]
MKGLLWLVIVLLDIVAIVDCAKSSMSGGKKALWILLVLILPLAGMILYFAVGKQKS